MAILSENSRYHQPNYSQIPEKSLTDRFLQGELSVQEYLDAIPEVEF